MTDKDKTLLYNAIRHVPNFPKDGILFKDLTPIMLDSDLFRICLGEHVRAVFDLGDSIDIVVGMESRGFWFGPTVAFFLGAGFVPARKPGKLPCEVVKAKYGLEYGTDEIQIHKDAIKPGDRVLIIDDVLATGGTAEAVGGLVKELGGDILTYLFAIELDALRGREKLGDSRIESLFHFGENE